MINLRIRGFILCSMLCSTTVVLQLYNMYHSCTTVTAGSIHRTITISQLPPPFGRHIPFTVNP